MAEIYKLAEQVRSYLVGLPVLNVLLLLLFIII